MKLPRVVFYIEPTTQKLKLNSYKHVAHSFPNNPNYFAPCLFKDNLSYYIFKIDIQREVFFIPINPAPTSWGLGLFCFCLDFRLVGFFNKKQNHFNQSLFIQTFILLLVKFWKNRKKKSNFLILWTVTKKLFLIIGLTK